MVAQEGMTMDHRQMPGRSSEEECAAWDREESESRPPAPTTSSCVNGGSPVGPGFVVYERASGVLGYDLALAKESIGVGWHPLLERFFERAEQRQGGTAHDIVVIQVKEKFGTLRIYFHGGDDFDLGYAAGLEAASALLCETCGARGSTRGGSWLRTVCDACDAQP